MKRLLICLLLAVGVWKVPAAWAQQPSRDLQFEHPPLQYRGPDPTAGYFLPADAYMASRPDVESLPPPSQLIPNQVLLPSELGASELGPAGLAPLDAVPGWPGGYGPGEAPAYAAPPFLLEDPGACCPPVTEYKSGFFQKLAFTGSYIDRGNQASYGIDQLDLSATFALPMPSKEWPLLITPAFNVLYLDGPVGVDLPARIYETYVDFLWAPRFSDRWTGILGVAPSVYSDFQTSTEAFRLTGKALIRWDWAPNRLQLIAGVLYLNRDDVRILPAGGLIWVPAENRRYELLFPRPKLAHRIACGSGHSDWVYLLAEFGGNTWAIERSGLDDKVTLRDYRLLIGLERKKNGGAGYRIEVGYVFGREAQFASGFPTVDADDTAIVRGGVTY